jgi:hypothetical protein
MELGLDDFVWTNPFLRPLEGVGPENLDFFWAQMTLAVLVAISGSKKVSIFRAHPIQWYSKWIFPHQNHYVPLHINNRYINSNPLLLANRKIDYFHVNNSWKLTVTIRFFTLNCYRQNARGFCNALGG